LRDERRIGHRAGGITLASEMRLRALGALAVTLPALMLGLVFFKGNAAGQQKVASTKGELTGTWRLVSAQNEKSSVFDASGRFASQVMQSDLPKFASPTRRRPNQKKARP
jgi:hypothetical protein